MTEQQTDLTTPLLYGLIALCMVMACAIWHTKGIEETERKFQSNCISAEEFRITGYNGVYSCIRVW